MCVCVCVCVCVCEREREREKREREREIGQSNPFCQHTWMKITTIIIKTFEKKTKKKQKTKTL